MAVRQIEPIDRAELRATIQKWIDAHTDVDDTDGVGLLEDVLWEINAQPTLTPQNEWISVEQLREMDGEPVWVEDVKHWALIDIEKGGQWDGVPFAIWAENGTKFTYNVESRGLHCYRCPPEGEEDRRGAEN